MAWDCSCSIFLQFVVVIVCYSQPDYCGHLTLDHFKVINSVECEDLIQLGMPSKLTSMAEVSDTLIAIFKIFFYRIFALCLK